MKIKNIDLVVYDDSKRAIKKDRMNYLFWQIRCVIAWAFYITGLVGGGSYFLYILYLAFIHYGPEQFAARYPSPADGFLFISVPILIYVVLAGLGRLLSWTSFGRPLPRLRDFGQSYYD